MKQAPKILILDDEQVAADLLSSVLRWHFPEAVIRVVHSGEEAVVECTEHRPDAAIFDLEMEGIGGEDAAVILRAALLDAPPLLIAFSGNLSRLATLREKGPFDHLMSKPADIAALVDLLKQRFRTG